MSQPVPSLADMLDHIRSDRVHGSRQMAIRLLRELQSWLPRNDHDPEVLGQFLATLEYIRPAMSVFPYLADELRPGLETRKRFQNRVNELLHRLQVCDQIIGEKFRSYCRQHEHRQILTHSRSSTVESALRYLAGEELLRHVFCTESRPGYEGVALAVSLQTVVPVTVLADTNIMRVLPDTDCVLLGADAVDYDGNISNKTGSRMIALLARKEGIPVVVLADRSKWQRKRIPVTGEDHSPSELGHVLPGITVLNTYFERVERALITTIISDHKEEK